MNRKPERSRGEGTTHAQGQKDYYFELRALRRPEGS